MGFWSDLSMGLGITKPTQDYVDRTAKTIERTQGSNNASTYSNQMTNKINENTGQNFQNNYTPSEGSQAVVNQNNDNDDNRVAPAYTGTTPKSNVNTVPNTTFPVDNINSEQSDRSTMFGGQLKDYSNLNSNRFEAYDLTQDGYTVGYSKYGKSAGSTITVTSDGKFKLTPSDAVSLCGST